MELLVVVLLALIAWAFIGPIFGVLAFNRVRAQKRQIERLRRRLDDMDVDPATRNPDAPVEVVRPPETPPPETPQKTAIPERVETPVQARSAQPAPPPQPRPAPASKTDWSLEEWVAGGWMVWGGGLALALGGLLLARVAIDAGLFGPLARTLSAAVFGGLLIAGAFRAQGMPLVVGAQSSLKWLPQLLAGAGLVSLFGATLASGALYGFVPPLGALALFALVCIAGLILALRFGVVLAALSLTGGYVAPFFIGAWDGPVLYLLAFAASISALGLALIRLQGWRFISWITLIGAGFWGFVALADSHRAEIMWAIPTYSLGLAAWAIVVAADKAKAPVLLPNRVGSLIWLLRQRGESIFVAHLYFGLAGLLILAVALQPDALSAGLTGLALLSGVAVFTARQAPGFGLLAPLAAAICILGLMLWPDTLPGLVVGCFAVAAGFGLVGTWAQSGQAVRAPLAVAAAITPLACLAIAFWRGALDPALIWGLSALGLALAKGAWLDRMRQKGEFDTHPGAAAAYAIGLALSACLAPFLVLDGLWLGPSLAVSAGTIAVIHNRFPLAAVRGVACVAAAGATFLMLRPGLVGHVDVAGPPVFNTLSLAVVLSLVALGIGAIALNREARSASAFQGAMVLTGFGGLGLIIRQAAGADHLFDGYLGLAEASGHAIAYLGSAAGLAWRHNSWPLVWRIGEGIAFCIGGLALLAALDAVGWDPSRGVAVFNLLLPAFALPALFVAVQAEGHRRANQTQLAMALSVVAILIGGLWLAFEVRRAFVGGDLGLSGPTVAEAEMWAYSVVGIVYALALLVWGVWRVRPIARYVSLGLLLTMVVKVFLIDVGALDGVLRALSFVGLGLALIGVALFYQRFVFERPSRTAEEPL